MVAVEASGRKARLETYGPALLRSICKLVYDGHGAYVKGDGKHVVAWLEDNYPSLWGFLVGRVELASRQDWSCEVSEKILPLIGPIIEYLVSTLRLDSNILRDSTLQRWEVPHF